MHSGLFLGTLGFGLLLFLLMTPKTPNATISALVAQSRTGSEAVDKLAPLVAENVLALFGNDLRIMRTVIAMIRKESGGQVTSTATLSGVTAPSTWFHDAAAPGGPGVGPLAVNRATAKALGLWTPPSGATPTEERSHYLKLAPSAEWGIRAGVLVLADKMRLAKRNLSHAVALYNGSGAAAELYSADIRAFVYNRWRQVI